MSLDPDEDQRRFEHYEARLADALCARDPGAAFAELRADPVVGAWLGNGLDFAREDGFRIAALLVARLRFERLLHGSREAGDAFHADARAFTDRFRRYHASVAPIATTPTEEAAQFEAWSRA